MERNPSTGGVSGFMGLYYDEELRKNNQESLKTCREEGKYQIKEREARILLKKIKKRVE